MTCPICNQAMSFAANAAYYSLDGPCTTPMFRCDRCDIYARDLNDSLRIKHIYAAGYVQTTSEQAALATRQRYFDHILDRINSYFRQHAPARVGNLKLVDIGSAYGHLLTAAQKRGFTAIGVEPNLILVNRCRDKGQQVFCTIEEVSGEVDVFTAVDSFYYLPNPAIALAQMRERLAPGGVIFLRVTNRNWVAQLLPRCRHDLSILGDCLISYSPNAIFALAAQQNLEAIDVAPDTGRGKLLSRRQRLYYGAGYVATILTRRMLAPGVEMMLKAKVSAENAASTGAEVFREMRKVS